MYTTTINNQWPSCSPGLHWVDYTVTAAGHAPLRGFLRFSRDKDEVAQIAAVLAHIEKRGGITAFPGIYDVNSLISDTLVALWTSENESTLENLNDTGKAYFSYIDIERDIGEYDLGGEISVNFEHDELSIAADAPSLFNWHAYYNSSEEAVATPKQCAARLTVDVYFDADKLQQFGITSAQAAASLQAEQDEFSDALRLQAHLPALTVEDEYAITGGKIVDFKLNH